MSNLGWVMYGSRLLQIYSFILRNPRALILRNPRALHPSEPKGSSSFGTQGFRPSLAYSLSFI
eukprot:264441-Amorphochlora_amoeboformis.AAC.1